MSAGQLGRGRSPRIRRGGARYRELLGVTTLIVRGQWPGVAQDALLRSIRLRGEQVRPHLA